MAERHEVCLLLDKLSLEMLKLMEEKVQCQLNIENATANSSIHLAKSRYIMGQQNVSSVQLPTENTPDFSALSTISTEDSDSNITTRKFALNTRNSEPDSEYVNPIRWFGVLVPQNLYQAQNMFKNALNYVIESVNVQNQLNATCKAISQLRILKEQLTPEE